jgi:hypothetical protein
LHDQQFLSHRHQEHPAQFQLYVIKCIGPGLPNIVYLFSKEFIVLILIAFLIAAPLAWYVMQNWLQNFAYHIQISTGIFITAIIA